MKVGEVKGVGGQKNSNFVNQISQHFRQFLTLFIRFFLGYNLILLVTDGRFQNFKTLAQSLLEEFR
jgi:hypothetical protein